MNDRSTLLALASGLLTLAGGTTSSATLGSHGHGQNDTGCFAATSENLLLLPDDMDNATPRDAQDHAWMECNPIHMHNAYT